MIHNSNKFIKILPGLMICIIIAYSSKFLANYFPHIGSASLSIFIGMFVGNTFGNKKIYADGSKFAESDLLSCSIVLLGGTLSIQALIDLGFSGVLFIIFQMVITISVALILGKKFGFSENFRFLMASGNAVCGSSAIGATAPVIGANDDDKGIAITIVNVIGTILMLLLPLISNIVFNTDTLKTSALIGGVLQSVGQVIASGSLVNDQVKDLATVFKIVRIIFLVFVILAFTTMKNKSNNNNDVTISKNKIIIPWYVIGFFITCILFTFGLISNEVSSLFKLISNNFEIIALAGIGMRVKFTQLINQGPKATLYGISIAIIQIISAITLITLLIR